MLDLRGGDEIQSSSKKSRSGKTKHKSKKQQAQENNDDVWEDVVSENGITEEVIEPPIAAIQDTDMVEPPSSRKKKNKKKSRKSLESFLRSDDTDIQVAGQLLREDTRDAPPEPLVFNGVTAESITKSDKKIKKPMLSSPPQLVDNDVLVENKEPAPSSPIQLSSPKKKKKKSKKKQASMGQEGDVLVMGDQPELPANGDADTTIQDDTLHKDIVIPSSLLSPQQTRKSAKKEKSKSKLNAIPDENIPEGSLDYQAKSRKSKKKKEQKPVRRSLSDDFAGVLDADSLSNAELEVSVHNDVDVDHYAEGIREYEQGEEMHDEEVPNYIQPQESDEPEEMTEFPEPEIAVQSAKKSKKKKKLNQ